MVDKSDKNSISTNDTNFSDLDDFNTRTGNNSKKGSSHTLSAMAGILMSTIVASEGNAMFKGDDYSFDRDCYQRAFLIRHTVEENLSTQPELWYKNLHFESDLPTNALDYTERNPYLKGRLSDFVDKLVSSVSIKNEGRCPLYIQTLYKKFSEIIQNQKFSAPQECVLKQVLFDMDQQIWK